MVEVVSHPKPKPKRKTPKTKRKRRPSDKNKHRDEIKSILAGLGIPKDNPAGQAWLALAGSENEYGLAKRAHRDSLRHPRPPDAEFRRFWETSQEILDLVLDKFEAKFGVAAVFLNELLSKTAPTRQDAKRLANHLPENPILLREFFANAGPKWLQALKAEGFFRRPPDGLVIDGALRCPVWPESGYLARMAGSNAEIRPAVLEILLPIANTKNFWVQEDILDATLALPAASASQLIPAIKEWLEGPISVGSPEKCGKLVRGLALNGQVTAALELARALLRISPDRIGGRATAALDLWYYEQVLREDIPDLVRIGGLSALSLLCNLLEQAVRTTDGEFRDYSQVWRPSITDHPQNELPSIESALVSAVRDAVTTLLANGQASVPDVLQELESRRYTVFRRLALNLLRTAGEDAIAVIESRLSDRSLFFDPDVLPEYAFLLRDSFDHLSYDGQAKILDFIEAGPELDLKRYEEWLRRVPTKDDVERYLDDWRFEKLGFIERSLSGEWRERYDQLLAKFGPPQRPREFAFWSTSWVGPTSPATKDALAALSDEELVSFLKAWQAPDERLGPGPSRDGLGRELTALACDQPGRFSRLAPTLPGLDPVYVAALLRGYKDAVRNGSALSWEPVLEFCIEAASQEPAEQPSDSQGEWSTVREDAAYLMQEGMSRRLGNREIPIELRQDTWEVIAACLSDPDPTPAREAKSGGDSYGTAINSARGAAMEAAIIYGLWVERHLGEGVPSGFANMPELRAALEKHLDPNQDSSRAIRSVYGRHFAQLTYLDPDWARDIAPKIFPLGTESVHLYEVAWDCYLQAPFYDACYSILSEHYSREVDGPRVGSSETPSPYSPHGHLAGHLMALHWHGDLDLADPNGVLPRFFRNASDQLRAEAIDCVGRSLPDDPPGVQPEVRERLEQFWIWRIEQARETANPQDHQEELAAFGRWFASPAFEAEWAVSRFEDTLQLEPRLRSGHLELGRLASLADSFPRQTVQCFQLMTDLDQNGSLLLGSREEPKTILAAAIRSGDVQARNAALALANRLIARGYLAFRELLPGPGELDKGDLEPDA